MSTKTDMTETDLEQLIDSTSWRKKPIALAVSFAESEGIVETIEGPVGFNEGDAIVTGIAGEQWPIQREKFETLYVPQKRDLAMGYNGVYVKKPVEVRALQLKNPFSVTLPNGDILRGKSSDWLVQYSVGDKSIVAAEIFTQTYEPVV